jgi:hypothetical protein
MDKSAMKKHIVADKNNDEKIIVCPMKCETPLDVPREYSKCGMKLKEFTIEVSK